MHAPVRAWSTPKVWQISPDVEPVEHDVSCHDTSSRLDRIRDAFQVADTLKILFVGETIIDEYRYVRALQKSAKEYVIATVETDRVEFAGGIAAAARQAEWAHADYLSSWKTLRKTRFVDADFKRKLFEVYSVDRIELTADERDKFHRQLAAEVEVADVVIVLDFGHGLLDGTSRDILGKAAFLAVNAQTNAGNYGFNPVTKYRRADFICIDEPEAQLAVGHKWSRQDLLFQQDLLFPLRTRMDCPRIIVTCGRNGLIGDSDDHSFELPAFSPGGIDTIGAGDAVMAVTAPLIAAGLSLEDAAFAGNVAGAIKVGIVGHERNVGRAELMAGIEARLA